MTAIGTAWLSLEAASDTLIAIALIIQLGHYTRKTNFAETQSLLRKLMFNAAWVLTTFDVSRKLTK